LNILPYLDIHTHRRLPPEGTVCVGCLSVDELILESKTKDYTSAGVHPWWVEDYTKTEIMGFQSHIEKMLREKKLWAIGETGIDRAYPEFLDEQTNLFHWHLDMAHEHELPVIIHNVRSASDFMGIMKQRSPKTPWIFHDFRGNEEVMRGLLRLHQQCYFSFGISLDNSPQVRELLPLIPMEHLFLETDEQKHLDIHDIYLRAAETLKVDLDLLKSQIWHNFRKISPVPVT